jgi:hypothetical protein
VPIRPNPKLSPELEEELHLKLADLLDEKDNVEDRKASINGALRGEIKKLAHAIAKTRRQLKGEELPQMEIEGTEKPEPTRDPVVRKILDLAGGIVRREEPKEEKPSKSSPLNWREVLPGKTWVGSFTGGRYVISVDTTGWTAHREEDAGRKAIVAINVLLEKAKELCSKDCLDRAAATILKSTGRPEDEKLARRGLGGEAEKSKKPKGGR